jgi:hypothetical protein
VTLGRLQRLLHDANATVRRADDRIRIGLGIVPASASDSILYAWAASPSSPVATVGFTLVAGPGGAPLLDARLASADRWMQSTGSAKEHWVFRAGGIPSVHGDEAQGLAIERILGWAMAHPGMRGAIVTHAADYGTGRGLRAASGRVRPAFAVVVRAVRETSR